MSGSEIISAQQEAGLLRFNYKTIDVISTPNRENAVQSWRCLRKTETRIKLQYELTLSLLWPCLASYLALEQFYSEMG